MQSRDMGTQKMYVAAKISIIRRIESSAQRLFGKGID
jgi:hypothetical protein